MGLRRLSRYVILTLLASASVAVAQQEPAPVRSISDSPVNSLRGMSRSRDSGTRVPRELEHKSGTRTSLVVERDGFTPTRPLKQASKRSKIRAVRFEDQTVLEAVPEPLHEPSVTSAPVDDYVHGHDHGYEHMGGDCLGGCDTCGSCTSCVCGEPHRFWARAEYLMWWTKGMSLPPLVTTSRAGTPVAQQGVLGQPNTQILYGNDDIFEDLRKGGRIRFGLWLDCCQRCGLEGDFLGLMNERETFRANCNDYPILDRPFFRVDGVPRQSAQIVCGPNLSGEVSVGATTRLTGGGIRFVSNRCCNSWGCDPCSGAFGTIRRDVLLGYRFLSLNESLGIREQLHTLGDNNNDGNFGDPITDFDLNDNFGTSSQFHGVDMGWRWEFTRSRWSLELLTKIALGTNRNVVTIAGSTVSNTNGAVTIRQGGLLTQVSNIGRHSTNTFSVMPELGVTAGYQLRPGIRLTAGYTFLYWTNVVRPGDQIDLRVNGQFLAGNVNAQPALPAFNFNESDYWAQGLNFGVDLRF